MDLRYDPLYDKIKEARREDDDAPQGDWATERKTADWPHGDQALPRTRSRTSPRTCSSPRGSPRRRCAARDSPGFGDGLDLIAGLVGQHWDHLYPEIDDGDAEMRAAPLEWIGAASSTSRCAWWRSIDRGHGLLQYREARLGSDRSAGGRQRRQGRRAEEGDRERQNDARGARRGVHGHAEAVVQGARRRRRCDSRGDQASSIRSRGKSSATLAPNYSRLREVVEEVQRVAAQQLKRKLELEPDPVDASAGRRRRGAFQTTSCSPARRPLPRVAGRLAAEPTSRDDAAARIVGAARYLRANDPFNPASYLMLRGFRWGELRVAGGAVRSEAARSAADERAHEAQGMLLDSRWAELLEACEGVMGTPQGRGWLDLQRYALTAVRMRSAATISRSRTAHARSAALAARRLAASRST